LVGIVAGVSGPLLPAQMADYGVGRATIGIVFFTFSAGFMSAGSTVGALIHRFGTRVTLIAGITAVVLAALCMGIRPAFAGLVGVEPVLGYGSGVIESVLDTHLTRLPQTAQRLNRLHAFFGVGALLGPLLATGILRSGPWPRVWLMIALLHVPLLFAVQLTFPGAGRRVARPAPLAAATAAALEPPAPADTPGRGLIAAALRNPGILLGALFLSVYVGLESSLGNWGFSFLVAGRDQSELLAGYMISGYWLGLTMGRFVIAPLSARAGLREVGMTYLCLAGVFAACGLVWLGSGPAASSAGFAVLGFFLGPLFPTTMALTPQLAEPRLVPTAIGVINGVSVIGGSALPWLAGAIGQSSGISTLLPYCIGLNAVLLLLWWRTARHVPASRAEPTAENRYAPARRCG
jgi:fucose permease